MVVVVVVVVVMVEGIVKPRGGRRSGLSGRDAEDMVEWNLNLFHLSFVSLTGGLFGPWVVEAGPGKASGPSVLAVDRVEGVVEGVGASVRVVAVVVLVVGSRVNLLSLRGLLGLNLDTVGSVVDVDAWGASVVVDAGEGGALVVVVVVSVSLSFSLEPGLLRFLCR